MTFEEIDSNEETSFSEANPLCEVIVIDGVYKHNNAHSLELISPDGSNVNFAIASVGQFIKGDKALWFDSVNEPMVPVSNPLFSILEKNAKNGYARIKAIRLRGEMSRGLLVSYDSAWDGLSNKQIADLLMIKKYTPNSSSNSRFGGKIIPGDSCRGPNNLLGTQKYDVESLLRNWKSIPNDTEVYITEKIHGANASYGWLPFEGNLEFWARSRTLFKKRPGANSNGGLWWDTAISEGLEEKLKPYPGIVLIGEVFGQVQDLKYGIDSGAKFAAFDCWDSNEKRYYSWTELVEFCDKISVKTVPLITKIIWNTDGGVPSALRDLAEGDSFWDGASNIREGFVLRATIESKFKDNSSGETCAIKKNLIYKMVGNGYLTRK